MKGIKCFEKLASEAHNITSQTPSRSDPERPIDDMQKEYEENSEDDNQSDDCADEDTIAVDLHYNGASAAYSTLICTGIDLHDLTKETVDFTVRDAEGHGMLLT